MQIKDYYTLLKIEPSATLTEIKKAYRQLALQYHPDTNPNDHYAAAQFTEIKEAYEVLTDPDKKEYYLQQRWYNQSAGKRKTQTILTPVNILKQVLELDRYVSTLDVHRMDKHGLYDYICETINDETIEKLNGFNETDINKEIVGRILNASSSLLIPAAFGLKKRLLKINTDEITVLKINNHFSAISKTQQWEKYRVVIIFLIVLLLSALIFFFGK